MRWIRNLLGASEPLVMLGKFAAGSSVAVKAGEILELTGNTNTEWVPMDSDFVGAANVAIAACNIKSGDLTGYYPIIVPRPGDVFEFALATAAATVLGASLYWSDSETLKATGTNVLGRAADQTHYPQEQGHGSDGDPVDRGTSVRSKGTIQMTFIEDVSYLKLFNDATVA
jgi:hypothetical protein